MPGFRASARPAFPILNKDSVLAEGLLSMVAAGSPQDLVQRTTMTGTLRQRGFGGVGGTGYQFTSANEGLRCTAPPTLQIGWPLTIAAHMVFLGTPPSSSLGLFGVTYDSAENNPFLAYELFLDGGTDFNIAANSGGSFFTLGGGSFVLGPTPFVFYSMIATFASGHQDVFINGVNGFTAVGTNTSSPTYGSGPILAAGESVATGRTNSLLFFDGMIWNRVLSASERAMLDFQSPWDLYWQPSNRAYSFMSAAAAAFNPAWARGANQLLSGGFGS
jgi:hypothetical protein